MTAENDEEEIENSSTKDEKTCDDEDGSLFIRQFVLANVTSVESSMGLSSVRFISLNQREIIWLSSFCRIIESNLQTDICYRSNELNFII